MWHLWSPPYGALPLITATATEFHSLNMACDEWRWRVHAARGGGGVWKGVWGMCGGIIIMPPPSNPHPPNHHWCDKNVTSPCNFIYSVDIRLWLKTIKKKKGRGMVWPLPWIAYANGTQGIYLVEARGTEWLTDCLAHWHCLDNDNTLQGDTLFRAKSGFCVFSFCPLFLSSCALVPPLPTLGLLLIFLSLPFPVHGLCYGYWMCKTHPIIKLIFYWTFDKAFLKRLSKLDTKKSRNIMMYTLI